jgi:S-adenosylmethionine decarboxylase
MSNLGRQYVVNFEECLDQFVSNPEYITSGILEAAISSGLHVLNSLEHRFEPIGLTYILLLSQSHLIVHTWPEYKTLILDLYVCSDDFDFESFIEKIVKISQANEVNKIRVF